VDVLLAVVVGLAILTVYQWWSGAGGPQTWRDGEGDALPDGRGASGDLSVSMVSGPEHCHWESVTFLSIAWPPGSVVSSKGEIRQFVHDPDGLFDGLDAIHGSYQEGIEAPPDAVTTGIHTDDVEVWISRSDPDAVFLRHGDGNFDRWPRADPRILCA
jgi:hypothetical protein